MKHFDVIVIGAGHAGIEATSACAKLGLDTLLISGNLDRVGYASCNPSFGGPGKSQLLCEVDALGGITPKIIDTSYIQARKLNESRGPAVWAYRAQIDKFAYTLNAKKLLEELKNVTLLQSEVYEMSVKKSGEEFVILSIKTSFGEEFSAKTFIITTGTFLKGKIILGDNSISAGRFGDQSSEKLSNVFDILNLKTGRLKTGTPPRIDGRSIDFSKMKIEEGEKTPHFFSFANELCSWPDLKFPISQSNCYLTYSNSETHNIILSAKDLLPMFNGGITALGPRYCPSFESKVINFPDRLRHPLFLEPESIHSNEFYLQGANTSAPIEIQEKFVKSIAGLESAKIQRYGYAIEYEFVFPNQLDSSLKLRNTQNLFLAGQINGTTGYEEAAGQGVVAGINAGLLAKSLIKNEKYSPFMLSRYESFIGILVDDLVTKDFTEPYRMFTARSENRLKLRCTNAWQRLAKKSYDIGVLDEKIYTNFLNSQKKIERKILELKTIKDNGISKFDQIKSGNLLDEICSDSNLTKTESTEVWVQIFYEGYIANENKESQKAIKNETLAIPKNFDYDAIPSLRSEARVRLKQFLPQTLGQASRISGVMAADISVLMIALRS